MCVHMYRYICCAWLLNQHVPIYMYIACSKMLVKRATVECKMFACFLPQVSLPPPPSSPSPSPCPSLSPSPSSSSWSSSSLDSPPPSRASCLCASSLSVWRRLLSRAKWSANWSILATYSRRGREGEGEMESQDRGIVIEEYSKDKE